MAGDKENQEILLATILRDLNNARDLLMEASLTLQDLQFELDVQQRVEAGKHLEALINCSRAR